MKILIDECLPAALIGTLTAMGHECETARRAGYGSKKNGELLTLAEDVWDVLLTSDRRMKYQQNMMGRKVAVVVLCAKSNRMKDLLPLMPAFAQALFFCFARSNRRGRAAVTKTSPLAAFPYFRTPFSLLPSLAASP